MSLSAKASRPPQQQWSTSTFVLGGVVFGVVLSGAITWGVNSAQQASGDSHSGRALAWIRSATRRGHDPFVPGSMWSRGADFVAAYFTAPNRHSLIEAGREWRRDLGIRTVVVTNVDKTEAGILEEDMDEFQEIWQTYPDISDENGTFDTGTIAYFPGDHRGAMTPLIAHRELGDTYKWMLYGDDDTIYFPEGVARAVEGLDPNMPYFLSDRSWGFGFGDGGNYQETPRCVPCEWTDHRGRNESAVPVPPFPACPCTRVELCEHWRKYKPHLFPECTPENLGMPVPHHMTFHGGGGTILSVGLLRALNWTEYEGCVKDMRWRQGSDSYTTKCIWRAGFGMTDPGYSYLAEDPLTHFTFDRWTFRGGNTASLVQAMQRKMEGWKDVGYCVDGAMTNATGCIVPDEEDELLVTMVSCHGLAGSFENKEQAATGMNLASTVYREFIDAISMAHPEVMHLDLVIGAGDDIK